MLARRNWLLRLSVILNVVILLYFGSHFATKNGAVVLIEELQVGMRRRLGLAFVAGGGGRAERGSALQARWSIPTISSVKSIIYLKHFSGFNLSLENQQTSSICWLRRSLLFFARKTLSTVPLIKVLFKFMQ